MRGARKIIAIGGLLFCAGMQLDCQRKPGVSTTQPAITSQYPNAYDGTGIAVAPIRPLAPADVTAAANAKPATQGAPQKSAAPAAGQAP